jgi:hypothetical protein
MTPEKENEAWDAVQANQDPAQIDAIAMQMCLSEGLSDDTAAALIWRIRGWIEANQRPGEHNFS